ncbi:hypothetical protein D9615_005211 [Tricholomella constricta]|uniref:Chromo domain-containing protein n=1 Tax=Tricholomella constricta TaxID=117010 RepID=A0A8H5H6R4_9AGAR|nr:hypothetical protein D9615_005211 [Tricholomella constricta]
MGKHKKKEEEEVYHVEVITKARVAIVSSDEEDSNEDETTKKKRKKKGKGKAKADIRWEYYVKWAGYDSDSNSWEPGENVAGCQRLLHSFWEHIGTDNADYYVGYEVTASDKWIKREKKYFHREFNEAQENLRVQRDKEMRERSKKAKDEEKEKVSFNGGRPTVQSTVGLQIQIPDRSLSESDEDSSDDDEPLMRKRKLKAVESSDDAIPLIRLPARKLMKTNDSTPVVTDPGPKESKETAVDEAHDWAKSLFSEPSSPASTKSPVDPAARPLPPPPWPSSRPSSAKTTPTIPSKLPPRDNNSYIKVAEMAPEKVASGSGISIKQRLAQGALAPTRPKAIPLPTPKLKPSLPPVKTALMNLSFKKKTVSTPVLSASGSFAMDNNRSPTMPQPAVGDCEPTLAALNAPLSPVSQDMHIPQVAASPQDYTMHEPQDGSAYHTPPWSVTTERTQRPPPIANPSMAMADRFLSSIMPPALAAPLTPTVEEPFEPQPPQPLVSRRPPPQQIPKKWSWSGSVFTEAKPSEPVFNVTFYDVTEHMQGGMRFSVALSSMNRLDFTSFHDAVDLDSILLACDGVHQFARLGPKGNDDVEPLQIFSTYMAKMQKVIFFPISLDNITVAHIIFFHHNTAIPARRFRPPFELQRTGSLVAALVPWTLTSAQLQKHYRKPPNAYLPANIDMKATMTDKARWERTIRTKAAYQHALRILKFPQWLHKYMSEEGRERTYWVWWEGGDGTKKKPGVETQLLHTIMDQCRAKKPRNNLAEIRIVFVHVGAIKTLYKLPGFLDFCSVSSHIQFYTYGTHHTVPPPYWGVREIYPCGGIVSFTPRAIFDDPIGVLHRIGQIQSHPLWECYILPTTLGMVAKLYGQKANEDPLALFDRGLFPYVGLLNAIENGELALVTSPPAQELSPTQNNNPRQDWLNKYWIYRPHGPRSILQSTVDTFNFKYGDIQQGEWIPKIHSDISKDLASMRCQPVFMGQYRRYVVFESPTERRVPVQDGLEWTTVTKFDFKDDFFPKQE